MFAVNTCTWKSGAAVYNEIFYACNVKKMLYLRLQGYAALLSPTAGRKLHAMF